MDKIKTLTRNPKKTIKNPNRIKADRLTIPNKIALWITSKVGTFGFFIFCVCLTVIPFIVPIP